jgi:hypothetical protein
MAQTSLRNQHYVLRARIRIRCKPFSYSRRTRFDSKVGGVGNERVLGKCAAEEVASKDDLGESPSTASQGPSNGAVFQPHPLGHILTYQTKS